MAEGRHIPSHATSEAGSASSPEISPLAVRAELAQVLRSHEFRTSKRCQDFLRYVVETALDGRADQLKERTIGIDVFARPASYDPSDDATVRVKAGEVRKRLGLYYAGDGHEDAIRIDLPSGAYVPEFRAVQASVAASAASVAAVEQPKPARIAALNRTAIGVAAVSVAVALGLIFYTMWPRTAPRTIVDRFWKPVLQQATGPVVLSAAYVPVYFMNRTPGSGPPASVNDFTPLNDQFVGGGDLLAIATLGQMLDRMHRAYQVKIGTEVSFSDLRTSPTVLVGYSYTRWKQLSKDMRYYIDAERRPLMILDNGKPTRWSLPDLTPDKHTDEDYAIVSRVFQPDTRSVLMEIAGITQYGTTAAAELVSNPDLLSGALKTAPAGWENKNLQLVLHTRVISGVAASQSVVATHIW